MQSDEEQSFPLVQLPVSWDDQRLLDHDPLRNLLACADEINSRTQSTNGHWARLIKDAIRDDKEFVRAYIRWCLLAFRRGCNDHDSRSPTISDFATKSSFWEIFVEICFIIHEGRKQNNILAKTIMACRVLNDERMRLGFNDILTLKDELVSGVPSLANGRVCEASPERGQEPAVFCGTEVIADRPSCGTAAMSQLLMLHADEIEDATEQFMKTICKGPMIELQCDYKRPRKAAPSRQRMAYLARMDEEAKKALAKAKKVRKGKPKGKRPAKGKTATRTKTNGRTVDSEGCPQAIDGTIQALPGVGVFRVDTSQIAYEGESIVADNMAVSYIWPIITGDSPNLSSASQKQGKARKPKKRPNEVTKPTISLSKSQVSETGKKKGKASNTKRKCEPTSIMPGQTRGLPPNDSVASSKRGKKTNKSEPAVSDYFPASKRKRISKLKPQEVGTCSAQAGLNSWPSSDDTLVGEDGNWGSSSLKFDCCRDTPANTLEGIRREKLLEILKNSYPRPCFPKPMLPAWARPRIWAGSRQALCESASWFRGYHGGVYFSDGKVHGYLLGGYAAQRDMYCHGGKLIISHGGGKSLEGSGGQREGDASVRALLYNYEKRHPLVLLIDDKYAPFPFDLGEKMYVVLGLYWIVGAWAEIEVFDVNKGFDRRIKYKFAFQYCEGQGPPWWSSPSDVARSAAEEADSILGPSDTDPLEANSSPLENRLSETLRVISEKALDCLFCHKESPRIYQQKWMCLNPDCSNFFHEDSFEVLCTLQYEKDFLELRRDPGFGKINLSLPPPLPTQGHMTANDLYSTVGWWCPDCGQLCPREKWEYWECPQCSKSFPLGIRFPIRTVSELLDQKRNIKTHKVYEGSGITITMRRWRSMETGHSGMHYVFNLPGSRGRIHLLRGNEECNQRANELFQSYQEDALGKKFLRRYPLRFHHARGRMLTNYFSHNAGVPYKYAVTTNITDSFDQAPPCVNQALQLIKERVSLVVQEDADFNEILTAAYMENQKMSYHTDDEKGLGPVVASLSLGSIAHMHFRNRKTPESRNIDRQLSIVLRHGDVLAMEGALIQKLYEHSVVPTNFRIAATARCIDQGPKTTNVLSVPPGARYIESQP